MRKTLLLASIAMFSLTPILAQQDTGVTFFEGTLHDAITKAAQEKKLLFVDCFFEACAPCQVLEKKILPQKPAGDFFNKEFVNYRIDVHKEYAKSIGMENSYQTGPYPTLLFLDSTGREVFRRVGCGTVEDLIESGRSALEFARLTGNVDSLKAAIGTGKTSPRQMLAFLLYLVHNASVMLVEETGDKQKNQALINNYFKTQSFQDLFDINNLGVIFHAAEYLDATSREYNFMLTYRDLFYDHFNTDAVNKKLLIVSHTTDLKRLNTNLATSMLNELGQATTGMNPMFVNYSRYPKPGNKTSIGF